MVGLDTIKIKVDFDQNLNIDYSKLESSRSELKRGVECLNISWIDSIDFGLNRIKVDHFKEEVIFSLSAKILKDNYKQSISLNTVSQLVSEINSHKIISVRNEDILKSTVLSCDPVKTICVENINNSILSVIQHATLNSKYDVRDYTLNGSLGYSAKRKVKSYKERQSGYCKILELNKNKSNRTFAKRYPKMTKSFGPNDLRIESNLGSFKMIREQFKISYNSLGEVLNSNEKVNCKIFRNITNQGLQNELFSDRFNNMKFNDIVLNYGYSKIFQIFNNDFEKIEKWIKTHYPRTKTKNSAYYQIKKIRKYYEKFSLNSTENHSHIEEISQLLRND